MFKKKNTTAEVNSNESNLRQKLNVLEDAQKNLINKIQSRKIYDIDMPKLPPLDFTKQSNIEYIKGVFIKDISTDEQTDYGLGVFYVQVAKDVITPLHKHDNRYQFAVIKKGVVIDELRNIKYKAGDIVQINKSEPHSLKYLKGTKLLLMYLPGLSSN